MAVQTNIAMDSSTTSSISLHGWYYSDSGTQAVKAEFYCNGSLFATQTTSGSANWTTSSKTKSGLSAGTTYSFSIKFFIADGREWGSASDSYTTDSLPSPPGLPSSPQTTITNGNTATISFTKGTNAYFTHMDIAPYNYSNLDYTNTKTTTGTSITWSGLLYNTTYYIAMQSESYDMQFSSWTTTQWWFRTGNKPLPEVPSSPPTITGRGTGSIDISWGAGTYADYYKVAYRKTSSSTWIIDSTNWGSLEATITGLNAGTSYDFKVRSENEAGSSAYTTVTTGYTNPDIPSVEIVSKTTNSITVKPTITTGGYSYIRVYEYNASGATITYADLANGEQHTFTGLALGAIYKYNAVTYYTVGGSTLNSAYSSTVQATTSTRPQNFTGFTNIASGASAFVYATDWNAFTTKINEFRVYKGLTNYSFSTATAGNNITATIFNQAINAMSALSTYFTGGNTIPTAKSSGDDCYASYFTDTKNALNSIQ